MFIDKSKYPKIELTQSIQNAILDFINSLKLKQKIYPAFYLTNKRYLKVYKSLIKEESLQFKLQVKAHYHKINQEVANQIVIKEPDTTRSNLEQYSKLNKLIQSLILYENDPLFTNAKKY